MNFKLPSSNDGKSTLKRPRAIDVEPRSPRAATVDSYTPRTRQKYILSKACTEAMGCPYFLKRWDKFKECANAQASEKSAPSGIILYIMLMRTIILCLLKASTIF